MNVKHLLATAAIAASALTFGSALAPAAPLDPPPTDPNPAAPPHPGAPAPGHEVLAVRARRTWQRPRRWRGAGLPAAVSPRHPALSARLSCR